MGRADQVGDPLNQSLKPESMRMEKSDILMRLEGLETQLELSKTNHSTLRALDDQRASLLASLVKIQGDAIRRLEERVFELEKRPDV